MKPLTRSDPRKLGDVEILGRLGEGGMGVVYVGRTADDTVVAVKALRADYQDRDDLRARFDREATALGMVQGPGVASLVAVSEEADQTRWLAMEYVPGLDLANFLHRHDPLDAVTGAALGLVLAGALTDIHTAGLTHRDLKSSNVMLGPDGPRVVDFGLVAIGGAGGDLTYTNTVLGTPLFMAPEQISAATEVTEAADVYALGVVLVHATSGHYPYVRPNRDALTMAVLSPDVHPDLSGVPMELAALVAALMAHHPGDRPVLGDVRAQLAELLATRGLSPGAARALLAERTYVAGTEVPDAVPVTTRPATVAKPASAPPPSGAGARLAARTAERLRKAYARPAVA